MSKFKALVASFLLLPVLGFGVVVGTPTLVSAAGQCPTNNDGAQVSIDDGAKCAKSADQKSNFGTVIRDITNVLLFIIGAVAVIMIILGGIRYTTSNGDSNQVTAAKNTILYGVIGVIIALLAYAIVSFVIGSFSSPTDGGGGDGASGDAAS